MSTEYIFSCYDCWCRYALVSQNPSTMLGATARLPPRRLSRPLSSVSVRVFNWRSSEEISEEEYDERMQSNVQRTRAIVQKMEKNLVATNRSADRLISVVIAILVGALLMQMGYK